MWQRFTERARRVVLDAQTIAVRLGSAEVDVEHFFFALLDSGGVAIEIVAEFNLGNQDVRRSIEDAIRERQASNVELAAVRQISTAGKEVLVAAADEARRMRHKYLGTEHLLLGVARCASDTLAAVLNDAGATVEALRDKVRERLGATGSEEAPGDSRADVNPRRQLGIEASIEVRRVLVRAADKALAEKSETILFRHLAEAVQELQDDDDKA